MNTIHEFLRKKGVKSNLDSVNIPQVKEWLFEYSEYLLKLAAEKVTLELREYSAFGGNVLRTENMGQEVNLKNREYLGIDKNSILNIINELK